MSCTKNVKVTSASEAKKKKVQKSLKNVLTSPYSQHWSPVQSNELEILHESLEKNLPALVNLKSRIPWKHLRKFCKEDRMKRLNEKKEKIKATESNKPLFQMRSFLSVGLNETSRCLSHSELSCVVVDGSSQSKRIAVFLVNMSLAKHVPVLICPGLLELTLTRFGFKTIAFGIRKKLNESADEMKKLILLEKSIVERFIKQLSSEPILCDRLNRILAEIQNESKRENASGDEVGMEDSKSAESSSEGLETSQIVDSKLEKEDTIVTSESTLPENLYSYRTDRTYRVFVPQVTNNLASSTSEGYISVAPIKAPKQTHKDKLVSMQKRTKKIDDDLFIIDTGDLVKPPVVKRVKPNPKRANVKVKGS